MSVLSTASSPTTSPPIDPVSYCLVCYEPRYISQMLTDGKGRHPDGKGGHPEICQVCYHIGSEKPLQWCKNCRDEITPNGVTYCTSCVVGECYTCKNPTSEYGCFVCLPLYAEKCAGGCVVLNCRTKPHANVRIVIMGQMLTVRVDASDGVYYKKK